MKGFTLLIFLLLISSQLKAQLFELNSGVTADLWDVCFVDSLTGWAIGDSLIIKTTNGGVTWDVTQTNFVTNNFTKLRFIDKSNGFIQTQGKLFTSFDGGTNWSQIETENDLNVNDFYFINENTGWITLADSWFIPKVSVIAKTNDRGNTWQTVIKDSADFIISFIRIDFLDSNYGIVTKTSFVDNSETEFFKTKNGGDSWEYTGSFSSGISNLKIIDYSLIIAGGGCLTTSIDQGNNWSLYNDFIYSVKDISFADRENSWFLYVLHTGEHQVYYTDPTLSFTKMYETRTVINALDNFQNKYCWAVGNDGNIFLYKNNISNVETILELPKEFELFQNYPNPFNPSTTITYVIPTSPLNPSPYQGEGNGERFVTLKVYDILGREVTTLVNEYRQPGVYKVNFSAKGGSASGGDANKLTSGVYIYTIRSGKYVESKKMMLAK